MNNQVLFTAQFIGETSNSYEQDRVCQIHITYEIYKDKPHIKIQRADATGVCFYESLNAFLSNWNIEPTKIFGVVPSAMAYSKDRFS